MILPVPAQRMAVAAAALLLLESPVWAASFTVEDGQTVTSKQSLNAGESGAVASGGTLSVTSGVAITAKGDAAIDNSGTIVDTDDRAIRDNTGVTLTITNNAGASITSTADDAIQINKAASNVTLDNYGTITSGSPTTKGGQAIDWNAVTTGSNVLNNHETGLIQAYDADAVRPGVNGVVNNAGTIRSIYATESNDGVDAQENSGVTIVNGSNGSGTTAGTGLIEGSRHGITGGAADENTPFAMTITNNLGATIQGDDGSGINIDGYNANELVTITNYGTIVGNGVTGDGDGVDVDGTVYLVNAGTIVGRQAHGDVSEGVTVGGGTIINSGLIEGDNTDGGIGRGITLAGVDTSGTPEGIYVDSHIVNSGTIRGQSGSAIAITGGETTHTITIENLAGGLIEGGGSEAAIATGGTDTRIIDAGTIRADESGVAVDFGSSDSQLQVLGGDAQIIGDIRGGSGTSTVSIVPGAGNSFSYDGAMSDLASVDIGAGTTTLNGASTYTGLTTVEDGGTLAVNGSLASPVAVESGATLAGSGSVGSTTLASGATLSPGALAADGTSTIGTLTVDGDLTFASGSTYQVQADPAGTDSDLVHVTGVASLAGSVLHVGTDGQYAPYRTYTILTADGGVQGTFETVDSDYAFLDPTLGYASNEVDLTLTRNDVSFASLAQTRNQRAAAQALETLSTGGTLYTAVVTLAGSQAAAAFDALSGAAHASTVSALQGLSGTVANLPTAHLRANLDAGELPGAPTAQLGGPAPASALPRSAASPLWVQAAGTWSRIGNANSARTDVTSGSLFVGGDADVSGGWRLGAALGYTRSRLDTDGLASRSDVDSYTATFYGGKAWDAGAGRLRLTGGIAYTWHDIDSRRSVAVGSLAERLDASYGASTSQVFGELGYALPAGPQATLEPFAGLAWSDLHTRSFSESGGTAAVSGGSGSTDITTTTLGVRAGTGFALGAVTGTLRGSVAWRHAFGDVVPESTLSFQDSASYTVTGAPIARDAAALTLGMDLAVARDTTLGLAYVGQFGGGDHQHGGYVNLRWRFH